LLAYDLDQALSSIVSLRATVPADAFTAESLGTERVGSGVVIDSSGLIVTIGYLVMEASSVEVRTADGKAYPADIVAYDQASGFGLLRGLVVLLVIATVVAMTPWSRSPAWRASQGAAWLQATLQAIMPALPGEVSRRLAKDV